MTDVARWFKGMRLAAGSAVTRLVLYSILVGMVAGVGALVFGYSVEKLSELCMTEVSGVDLPREGKHVNAAINDTDPAHEITGPKQESPNTQYEEPGKFVFHTPPMKKRLWILLIPAIGGLFCGILVFTLAPEAEGHGTDSVVEAFHQKRGVIRKRIPIVKMVSSVLTLGTGGCAGREGPIAQVSAGFGSILADIFKLSSRQRRILIIAGVGAGVGAMFRAPLGGALFAVEVLYRDMEFESEALIPAFIASIVSYTTFACLTPAGVGSIFTIPPNLAFTHPSHLLLCVILSIILVVFCVIYVKVFYATTDLFRKKIRIKPHFKPMLGGLIIGLIGFCDPRFLTTGYGWVQEAINGNLTFLFMASLAVIKIVMTAVTVGSGGSGGVFGPSVVIGGLIGGAFGSLCQRWIPDIQPAAFVLLGMGGFFAGAAKVPISTIIMVSEMTVGYALLLPLMLVCSLTYLISPQNISIYIKQVARRIDSNAHLGDFVVDILERLNIRDIMDTEKKYLTVTETMGLVPLLEKVMQTEQTTFPVVEAEGRITGIIRLDDLRGAFMQPELVGLIISKDIAIQRFVYIFPQDNLKEALRKLTESRCAELPVVGGADSTEILGMVSRHEVIQAYSANMETLMQSEEERQIQTANV